MGKTRASKRLETQIAESGRMQEVDRILAAQPPSEASERSGDA